MSEYIKREDAIEEIMSEPPDAHYPHWYANKIKSIPAADVAPVQKWISVKDRSPEAGGYVVCIAKRNPFSRFMPMVAKIEKNGWVNPITEQYISDVSHWMPIPEPSKEK